MSTHINISDWSLGSTVPGSNITPAQLGFDIDGAGSIKRQPGGYNGSSWHAEIVAQRIIKVPPFGGGTYSFGKHTMLMIAEFTTAPSPTQCKFADFQSPPSLPEANLAMSKQTDGETHAASNIIRCSYKDGPNEGTDITYANAGIVWIKWIYDRPAATQTFITYFDGAPQEYRVNGIGPNAPDVFRVGGIDNGVTFGMSLYSIKVAEGDLYFPPGLYYRWAAADSDRVEIAGRITDCDQARVVFTRTLTGDSFTSDPISTGARGHFKVVHDFNGAMPNGSGFEYQVEGHALDGSGWHTLGDPGHFVLTAKPGQYSQRQNSVFWGCTRTYAAATVPNYITGVLEPIEAFSRIVCLGDFHYKDPWKSDPWSHVQCWEKQLLVAPEWAELQAHHKVVIMRSDHDGGTSGVPGEINDFFHGPAITFNIQAYDMMVPNLGHPLNDPGESSYFEEMDGRILRLYLDTRSNFRSDPAASDSSGLTLTGVPVKSPLGEQQDIWLANWANDPRYNQQNGFVGISIASDFGYIAQSSGDKPDIFNTYPEWRDWFAALWEGKRMWMINGDWHQGYIYTAAENKYGDFFGMGACGADRESGNTVSILPPEIPARIYPDPWGLDEFPIFLFGTELVEDKSTELKVTLAIHDALVGGVVCGPYSKEWTGVPIASDSPLGFLEALDRNLAGTGWNKSSIMLRQEDDTWLEYIAPV